MKEKIELGNISTNDYCILDIVTGEKSFSKEKTQNGYTGTYFQNEETFFALYPTKEGPKIYFEGKEYSISRDLEITVKKDDKRRVFAIRDFSLLIKYVLPYPIGYDWWSTEETEDLFYYLANNYKKERFYELYTKL